MALTTPTVVRSRSTVQNLNQVGVVVTPTIGSIVAEETGEGNLRQTILTLTGVGQTVVNGTEYQSTQLYTFPEGRILIHGCVVKGFQQTTTSAVASTLNGATASGGVGAVGAFSLGSAAASSTTLSSTMINMCPSTAFNSSLTINVAGTAINSALAAAAQIDGTTTPVSVYLNTAYATTADVDADATQTISATIVITWTPLGDY